MTKANKLPKPREQPPVRHHNLDGINPKLKPIGGSDYEDWNNIVATQAMASVWYGNPPDPERTHKTQTAALCFLSGVEPKDELEGMLAAQLLASHNAAMECYRRAMIVEQTFEGRNENLNQANKLSRTHTHDFARSIEPPSRQRAAESNGRTRSRPRRRASHCRQCGGGRDAD